MINRMKATQTVITDFEPGAVGRTLVEAPAIEIEELYQQAFNIVTAAIPVSVYNSFNFQALQAQAATGPIRTSITAQPVDVLISAYTQFLSASTSAVYAATADITIPAGSTYADVPVAAVSTGTSTNLAEGTSFTTAPAIPGFVSAINLQPFVNGRDLETDDERLIRFNAYISTLSRATVPAVEYGLSTVAVSDSSGNVTEQVKLYKVVEPYLTDNTQPIALVNAYIHNGIGNTSSALLAQAKKIIAGYTASDGTKVPGYKAAGIPVNISIATEVPLNIAGVITLIDNETYNFATVKSNAQAAVYAYLQGLDISDTASLSQASAVNAEIVSLVKAVDGVFDFELTAPTANTSVAVGSKIMPGTFAFTQGAAL